MPAPPVGASAQITRTVDQALIDSFAALTGDTNPMHVSPEFARRTRFGRPIGHGMLTAGLISAVIGTKLPGPGCIWVEQSLRFRKPVYAGDVITTTVTVTGVNQDKALVTLRAQCVNQSGDTVLDGDGLVMLDDVADP